MKNIPPELDKIAKIVLAYRPKPKEKKKSTKKGKKDSGS
jgi:hypothetical protein